MFSRRVYYSCNAARIYIDASTYGRFSMNILVGCEFFGVVREAFRKRGHNAWSCDLLPAADSSPYHFKCDILDNSVLLAEQWNLAIFFPPCTYLCSSGARWWKQRQREQTAAIAFVQTLWNLNIPKIAQARCGANNLSPSPNSGQLRSITYQGIANAMAEQWG